MATLYEALIRELWKKILPKLHSPKFNGIDSLPLWCYDN